MTLQPLYTLADEVVKQPQVFAEVLQGYGYLPAGITPTLSDINAALLDSAEDEDCTAKLAKETAYHNFIGITATLIMTGISVYQTYRQTKDNRAKDIAENLMRVRQKLQCYISIQDFCGKR